ncbi:hypothetical protein F5884DRAFT_659190 [Xylogone sp. PMI_703]|nr:hypothetical protein F5884DRAFT_659190 [Xylogone sp. PMI_703]
MAVPTILIIGTCDTKLQELLYLRSQILFHGRTRRIKVILADTGRTSISDPSIDIAQTAILSKLFRSKEETPDLSTLPRSEVIKAMIASTTILIKGLYESNLIHGIISIGGSGGTSLSAAVMRFALPVGFPKLIVSTMASGDVSSFVGETDITIMHSVVDVAGLSHTLKSVLDNAAGAIAGMSLAYHSRSQLKLTEEQEAKKVIAITMFGVTTPAVDAARAYLSSVSDNIEILVFHATGAGGRAMERLITEGRVDGVLDLTTTELADELVGGVLTAGPNRLTAASRMGIPQVVSLGALDMVNFGPRHTVPKTFLERKLHEHNPSVTLLRTSPSECKTLGAQIAEKLRTHAKNTNLVEVWIPKGGVSMLSVREGDFDDPSADEALFSSLKEGLQGSNIKIIEDERSINDEGFSIGMAESLLKLMGLVA